MIIKLCINNKKIAIFYLYVSKPIKLEYFNEILIYKDFIFSIFFHLYILRINDTLELSFLSKHRISKLS